MSAIRTQIRHELADLLRADLVAGSPRLAALVIPYQVDDFEGASPTVVVTGAGTSATETGQSATTLEAYEFDVHVFVLYSDEESGWTEEEAEDRADEIEERVRAIVKAKRKNRPHWDSLKLRAASTITSQLIGGKDYKQEIIPLVAYRAEG